MIHRSEEFALSGAAEAFPSPTWGRTAQHALRFAAGFWFLTAVLGQLIFAFYIALFYGRATVQGDLARWNQGMPHGYLAGDPVGNFAVGLHLFLAILIILSGALQLIPQVRKYAPSLHRWNGRIYLLTAFLISIGGLFMVWVRGSVGDLSQHVSISINALLIMTCAAFALHYARARQFGAHRRWALRLFLVAAGVWFFRIGLMLWLFVNKGPVGFDPQRFEGPFLTFLAFAQYLLPLAILELYLRAKDRGGPGSRLAMAGGLTMLTLAMGVGIAIATMGMWLPRLR
ncbi:DUF2306 domain-containing protein [Bryobacter aggregatus]|uniref:DUF2306 domain-containing protein n=1 Tax=Bryobacter aggregatus TaxID=360054 RepID=UPI00068D1852|nr:DUF2306 domain-containing protein [Bryobacter aggregatus]